MKQGESGVHNKQKQDTKIHPIGVLIMRSLNTPPYPTKIELKTKTINHDKFLFSATKA